MVVACGTWAPFKGVIYFPNAGEYSRGLKGFIANYLLSSSSLASYITGREIVRILKPRVTLTKPSLLRAIAQAFRRPSADSAHLRHRSAVPQTLYLLQLPLRLHSVLTALVRLECYGVRRCSAGSTSGKCRRSVTDHRSLMPHKLLQFPIYECPPRKTPPPFFQF